MGAVGETMPHRGAHHHIADDPVETTVAVVAQEIRIFKEVFLLDSPAAEPPRNSVLLCHLGPRDR